MLYIVPIFLNHITFLTKVGVSYTDHMNDDTPEAGSFITNVTKLSPPQFYWGDNTAKLSQSKWAPEVGGLWSKSFPFLQSMSCVSYLAFVQNQYFNKWRECLTLRLCAICVTDAALFMPFPQPDSFDDLVIHEYTLLEPLTFVNWAQSVISDHAQC